MSLRQSSQPKTIAEKIVNKNTNPLIVYMNRMIPLAGAWAISEQFDNNVEFMPMFRRSKEWTTLAQGLSAPDFCGRKIYVVGVPEFRRDDGEDKAMFDFIELAKEKGNVDIFYQFSDYLDKIEELFFMVGPFPIGWNDMKQYQRLYNAHVKKTREREPAADVEDVDGVKHRRGDHQKFLNRNKALLGLLTQQMGIPAIRNYMASNANGLRVYAGYGQMLSNAVNNKKLLC